MYDEVWFGTCVWRCFPLILHRHECLFSNLASTSKLFSVAWLFHQSCYQYNEINRNKVARGADLINSLLRLKDLLKTLSHSAWRSINTNPQTWSKHTKKREKFNRSTAFICLNVKKQKANLANTSNRRSRRVFHETHRQRSAGASWFEVILNISLPLAFVHYHFDSIITN